MAKLQCVAARPVGFDYEAYTPLYRRVTETFFREDDCAVCVECDRENICFCQPDSRRLKYTQVVVSVCNGETRRPHDAVFMVRVVQGVSSKLQLLEDLLNVEPFICEFSLSDSLNSDWEENPHLPLVKEYLGTRYTSAQWFAHFQRKGQAAYVLAFEDIVQKILAFVPPPTDPKKGSHSTKKTNPHVKQRVKRK